MLQASLLWYKKFRKELEQEGFIFNPYDPCVANRVKKGSQQMVRFHVDDLMSSHINPKVNDDFETWLNKKYGDLGKVKTVCGKEHDYLGMLFDFHEEGKVKIDMSSYVSNMLEEFLVKLMSTFTAMMPGVNKIFNEEHRISDIPS